MQIKGNNSSAARFDLSGIKVITLREEKEDVTPPSLRDVITLKELLDKYTFALGYQNDHLLEVLLTLMMIGKVRVEFRSYTERLQLSDSSQMMTRPATLELFNQYLASINEKKAPVGPEMTRRITVQPPRLTHDTVTLPDHTPPPTLH